MRILLTLLIAYLVIRYLLRPIIMAFVVKAAGKMMEDLQNRNEPSRSSPTASKPDQKVEGEYVDFEEIK